MRSQHLQHLSLVSLAVLLAVSLKAAETTAVAKDKDDTDPILTTEPEDPTLYTQPVRNPFWPIGYEGEKTIISPNAVVARPEPVVVDPILAAASPENQNDANITTSHHWIQARKTLKIGGSVIAKEKNGKTRTCIVINSYPYADGDLISINHEERRFTWRVSGLSDDGVLRLERVRVRILEEDNLGK